MTHPDARRFPAPPESHDELTFQDMVAEQLRRAPWFLFSAAAHAVAILVLWLLVPADDRQPARHFAEVVDTASTPLPPEPEKPEPEKVEAEDTPTELELSDVELADEPLDNAAISDEPALTAFPDTDQWNPAVGLGGGATGGTGAYGDRGKRGPNGRAFVPGMEHALGWLARHQDEDGKWDCDEFMKHDRDGVICDGAGNGVHDVGVTGLALLAFLGDNNTMRSGRYRDNVRRGVRWLREQQQPNGLFGSATSHDFVYDHTIAAYAMCEAYGLSNYRTLRPVAQKALNYLESHRNPYGVWRYQPRELDGDTSITGWAIMAYESGRFFGLQVSDTALQLCATFLDQVSDASGRHGYRKSGERSSRKPGDHAARFPVDHGEAMTAVGLFCRYFLGQDPKAKPVMQRAAELIAQHPPVWDETAGTIDLYYWYYGTYALFQSGGRLWQQWQKKLGPAVLDHQRRDKRPEQWNLHGSWDPVGAWGEDGGRVYSTAILALCLQAHHRYSPLLR